MSFEKKKGINRFISSVNNSWEGLKDAIFT